MRTLALVAMVVGLAMSCGGGDDGKKILPFPDANDGPLEPCNLLTQAGCAAGEKCTWLVDAMIPQYVGHIGCAPSGAADVGDACMFGSPGATGYDGCKMGLV